MAGKEEKREEEEEEEKKKNSLSSLGHHINARGGGRDGNDKRDTPNGRPTEI